MKQERIVLHIDMDAFFAAIEERNNPHLRGEPIVVGADPKGGFGRGVVSTANYEARKYGIRSAMPISEAYRRCPHAIFLPVDHELYSGASKRIASILYSIEANSIKAVEKAKLKVEQVSIDEFYIEARDLSWEGAVALAGQLKDAIRKNEQLTCSIGIGPNPFVAKVASDFKKPDGLTLVKPDEVTRFLAPLAVRKIPGIGPKTEEILLAKNIKTIRDLRKATRAELVEMLGKLGDVIHKTFCKITKIKGNSKSGLVDFRILHGL